MNRNELGPVPLPAKRYIDALPDLTLEAALHFSIESLNGQLEAQLTAIGDAVYAPGKWTVADILQHLIDTERIMAYRALRFARQDRTPLPGFDEEDYATAAAVNIQPVPALLEELKLLHISTLLLFNGFTDAALRHTGMANGAELSVGALGFMMAGHQWHHLQIIQTRYLPLAKGIILPA